MYIPNNSESTKPGTIVCTRFPYFMVVNSIAKNTSIQDMIQMQISCTLKRNDSGKLKSIRRNRELKFCWLEYSLQEHIYGIRLTDRVIIRQFKGISATRINVRPIKVNCLRACTLLRNNNGYRRNLRAGRFPSLSVQIFFVHLIIQHAINLRPDMQRVHWSKNW